VIVAAGSPCGHVRECRPGGGQAAPERRRAGGGGLSPSRPGDQSSSATVTVFVHGWYAQGNVFADDFTLS